MSRLFLIARALPPAARWGRTAFGRRVPRAERLAALAALAYVLMPLDLLPDALPVLGWTDDAAVVAGLAAWAVRALARRRSMVPVRRR